jgi:hypothetical protein
MNSKIRVIPRSRLFFVLSISGQSIALMPRPDIDEMSFAPNSADRGPDTGIVDRERNRVSLPAEISGTVQRIDVIRREIHLQTGERDQLVFRYLPHAVVYDRDRNLPVEDLRSGDEISLRPGASTGADDYVDVIRMIDRRSDTGYLP